MPFKPISDVGMLDERPAGGRGFRPLPDVQSETDWLATDNRLTADEIDELSGGTQSVKAPMLARTVRSILPDAELETASRPAFGIRTRSGQVLFTKPEPFRDVFDKDVQGEQRAPWTGEEGVLQSLPPQMVAGARGAVANLRRMGAEEAAGQRAP